MEILIDTANVDAIRKYHEIYDLTGVTCNPTILSKEKPDFYGILDQIRTIIGPEKELHIQLTAPTCEEMLREAEAITEHFGREHTYLKVPTNEEGIKTMKKLKAAGCLVTATAIYTAQQGMLALSVGADYLAPYYNRMSNAGYDAHKQIADMVYLIDRWHLPSKILAASFHNTWQVLDALLAGAHAVTAAPEYLSAMVNTPDVSDALQKFDADWKKNYGSGRIYDL